MPKCPQMCSGLIKAPRSTMETAINNDLLHNTLFLNKYFRPVSSWLVVAYRILTACAAFCSVEAVCGSTAGSCLRYCEFWPCLCYCEFWLTLKKAGWASRRPAGKQRCYNVGIGSTIVVAALLLAGWWWKPNSKFNTSISLSTSTILTVYFRYQQIMLLDV